MFNESKTVVLNIGTCFTRSGFSGDSLPTLEFRSIVGKPKLTNLEDTKTLVGDEVNRNKHKVNISLPISNRKFKSLENLSIIAGYIFTDLQKLDAKNHPVLMTDLPSNSNETREKILETMMESLSIPSFYLADQCALSLYHSGRITGVVMELGSEVSDFVPIYEGKVLKDSVSRLDLGGRDIIESLSTLLLNEKGYAFKTYIEKEYVKDIRDKYCYVALDYENENLDSQKCEMTYELPDGNVINIDKERFQSCEFLFNPNIIDYDRNGIQEMLFKSISTTTQEYQKDFYENVVLASGTSLLPGLDKRLEKEFKTHSKQYGAPNDTKINIVSPSNRHLSSWIGGSMLSSINSFKKGWITREEYLESGSSIIEKCNNPLSILKEMFNIQKGKMNLLQDLNFQ